MDPIVHSCQETASLSLDRQGIDILGALDKSDYCIAVFMTPDCSNPELLWEGTTLIPLAHTVGKNPWLSWEEGLALSVHAIEKYRPVME